MTTIAELREHRMQLISYITIKAKANDWHAVADAAMDLREIDAKMDVLREVSERVTEAPIDQPYAVFTVKSS